MTLIGNGALAELKMVKSVSGIDIHGRGVWILVVENQMKKEVVAGPRFPVADMLYRDAEIGPLQRLLLRRDPDLRVERKECLLRSPTPWDPPL